MRDPGNEVELRVFVAIMEVKLELGSGLGLLVRVLGLGGYELDYGSSLLLLFCLFVRKELEKS